MEAIAAGLGVATTVAPAVDTLDLAAGVVFRPAPELSPLTFWFARREHDDRQHVLALIGAATSALQTGET